MADCYIHVTYGKCSIISHWNYRNNNLVNKSVFQESIEALKSLGYLESDILKVVSKYDENLSIEEIIKKSIKEL